MDIQNLVPIDWSNQRVLTTAQVAEAYGTTPNVIKENFRRNKEQFQEGVHYFKLTGESLRQLKSQFNFFDAPASLFSEGKNLASPVSKLASAVHLWTKEGCVRHCKMLNTQAAWDMFSELERVYFGVTESLKREEEPQEVQPELPFAKKYPAAVRRAVAREPFAQNAPAFLANPELADKLIAIADRLNGEEIHDKILIHAANLLIGQRLF